MEPWQLLLILSIVIALIISVDGGYLACTILGFICFGVAYQYYPWLLLASPLILATIIQVQQNKEKRNKNYGKNEKLLPR